MDQTQIMTTDKYGTRRNDSSSALHQVMYCPDIMRLIDEYIPPHPVAVIIDQNLFELNDITNYRTATFEVGGRFAIKKGTDTSGKFDIYSITNYVGTRNFKLVSIKPAGYYHPDEGVVLRGGARRDTKYYKTILLEEKRFAVKRWTNFRDGFQIYEINNYRGPRDFEVVSIPVGYMNPDGTLNQGGIITEYYPIN